MNDYRQNVAALLVSTDGKIWIGERADKLSWGLAQGGIESGEAPKEALKRELGEEIGTTKFDILDQYPGTLKYDFPAGMTFPTWTYKGQEQYYFLVKLDKDAVIKLDSHPEEIEFTQYKFVSADEFMTMDFHFKTDIYQTVVRYFKQKIEAMN
ncbi:MAG: RNA pyrophosphohydrolase [Lactococcus sp.]